MDYSITPRGYLRLAVTVLSLLLVADLAIEYAQFVLGRPSVFGLARVIRMDYEDNLPSVASGLNLIFAATLLAGFASKFRSRKDPIWRGWALFAIAFGFLALDELVSVHELVGFTINSALGMEHRTLRLWVVPYLLFAAVMGAYGIGLLKVLPAWARHRFVLSGLIFVGGAAGVEWLGGWYLDRHSGVENLAYAMMSTVEEVMEFTGVVVFVHTLLRYHCESGTKFTVSVVNGQNAPV